MFELLQRRTDWGGTGNGRGSVGLFKAAPPLILSVLTTCLVASAKFDFNLHVREYVVRTKCLGAYLVWRGWILP